MPGDGKIEKPEEVTGAHSTTESRFDSAKLRGRQLQVGNSGDLSGSINAPQTTEQAMRLVWKRALDENKDQLTSDLSTYEVLQKATVAKLYQIIEAASEPVSAPLDGKEIVKQMKEIVKQMKDHLKQSDQPPNIREIVGDLQLIIAMNLIGMKEVVNNTRKKGSVDEPGARKIHSSIFYSMGASSGYRAYIRDNIPLPSEKIHRAEKLLLKQPIEEFQKVLENFKQKLDEALDWKYKGLVFGIELSSPPNFDQTKKLSSNDLESSYEEVSQAGKALNKHLEYIISLGTSAENYLKSLFSKYSQQKSFFQ